MDYVSDLISQIWGKDKCLEAFSSLTVADPKDYAMLQGCGGKDHANRSGITIVLTDNTPAAVAHNGGKAAKVRATVPTGQFTIAKNIAEFNIGNTWIDTCALATEMSVFPGKATAAFDFLLEIIRNTGEALGDVLSGKVKTAGQTQALFNRVKAVYVKGSKFRELNFTAKAGTRLELPVYRDWEYTQTRVHSYDRTPDGRVGCAVLSITRKQYQEINGAESRQMKPWTISVSQFRAMPSVQKNGTVSYVSGSKANEMSAWVKLDDGQMLEFCHRIERFEEIWEIANCTAMVREAQSLKENKRKQAV